MLRRTAIAEPAIAITAHTGDYLDQVAPFFGQRIFHAWRDFGEGLAHNNSLFLKRAQPLGKRLGTDSPQRSFELIEAFDTSGQIADNKQCPLTTDNFGSAGNRAG